MQLSFHLLILPHLEFVYLEHTRHSHLRLEEVALLQLYPLHGDQLFLLLENLDQLSYHSFLVVLMLLLHNYLRFQF